jgi:putative SOS response-associated peptidase YedK
MRATILTSMPAILRAEDRDAWLNGTLEQARAALTQYAADLMVAYEVSTRVNSVKNNDPAWWSRWIANWPSASRHYFRRAGNEMMVGISMLGAAERKALN